jgi:hypothetical protein
VGQSAQTITAFARFTSHNTLIVSFVVCVVLCAVFCLSVVC